MSLSKHTVNITVLALLNLLQILKDWHLVAITLSVTSVTTLLLLLETAVPHLRGRITQEIDQEHPTGTTVNLVTFCVTVAIFCESLS